MDALSLSHTHLADLFDAPELDEMELAAGDIVLADLAYSDYATPRRSRVGVDMPAPVTTAAHTEVATVSPLATLRRQWDALPPTTRLGLGILGGVLVFAGAAWLIGTAGAKAALAHATIAAAPLAAAAL